MITPHAAAPRAATLLLLCALTACSVSVPEEDPSARKGDPTGPATIQSTAKPTGSSSPDQSDSGLPTVPGYDVGEFPAIPLIQIPDISVLSEEQQTISDTIDAAITKIPGLSVEPARCTGDGLLVRSNGTVLYGDGSGTFVDANGAVQNYGNGAGLSVDADSAILNFGNGAGMYVSADSTIQNFGNGAGQYVSADSTVQVIGNGTGQYVDADMSIQNLGNGAGLYVNADMSIQNLGNGAGQYVDADISIQNLGDGTGTINGVPVEMEPIAPVPPIGTFPPLEALVPVAPVCGTLITLPDSVLFDFDSADLRAEAGPVLEAVAQSLAAMPELASAITVAGHTDSISDDDYNQTLSERRARAVADALADLGLTAPLDAEGFGETQPVAENTLNGQDNPAGRQLNRRVEIVIPA